MEAVIGQAYQSGRIASASGKDEYSAFPGSQLYQSQRSHDYSGQSSSRSDNRWGSRSPALSRPVRTASKYTEQSNVIFKIASRQQVEGETHQKILHAPCSGNSEQGQLITVNCQLSHALHPIFKLLLYLNTNQGCTRQKNFNLP